MLSVESLSLRLPSPLPFDFPSQVPARGFLPTQEYARTNKITRIRQLPRRTYAKKSETMLSQPFAVLGRNAMTNEERARRSRTLSQMDTVLDGLNINTRELIKPPSIHGGSEPDNVVVRGVARPNTGIKKLVDMVNEVVSDLNA